MRSVKKREPYVPGQSMVGIQVSEDDRSLIEAIEEDLASFEDVEEGALGEIITYEDEAGKITRFYKAPRDEVTKSESVTEVAASGIEPRPPFQAPQAPQLSGMVGGGIEGVVEEALRKLLSSDLIERAMLKVLQEKLGVHQ